MLTSHADYLPVAVARFAQEADFGAKAAPPLTPLRGHPRPGATARQDHRVSGARLVPHTPRVYVATDAASCAARGSSHQLPHVEGEPLGREKVRAHVPAFKA